MDISDLFSSFTSFWEAVSITVLLHLGFLLGVRYVAGIELKPLERLNRYFKETERGTRSKALLDEFNLWTKLPFLALVGGLIYLTLFASIVKWTSRIPLRFVPLSWSEADLWRDRDPPQIADIAVYAKSVEVDLNDVATLKSVLLDEYRLRFERRWDSWVGWTVNEASDAVYLFHGVIAILIVFLVCVGVAWRKGIRPGPVGTARILALVLLVLATLPFLRYRAEAQFMRSIDAELSYVVMELEVDPMRTPLPEEQAAEVRDAIAGDLEECSSRSFYWLQADVDDSLVEDILAAVTSADEYDHDLLGAEGELNTDDDACVGG